MENKQKSIELCNLGIAQKRIGNFEKALEYYEKAKEECKINPDIYYNTAKILIGLGNYSLAFKNIMTYSQITRLTSDTSHFQLNIFMSSYWIDNWKRYYWGSEIYEGFSISKDELDNLSSFLASYYSMVLDFNNCFLAGLCFILEDPALMKFHSIDENLVNNIKSALLGQTPNAILKNNKFENLFNATGLYFIVNNYILFKNNLEEVSELYFSKTFKINRNLIQIKKLIPDNSENLETIDYLIQERENKLELAIIEFNKNNFQKSIHLIDNLLVNDPTNARAYLLKGKSYFYLVGFPPELAKGISNLDSSTAHFIFMQKFISDNEAHEYLLKARNCLIKARSIDGKLDEEFSKLFKEIEEWLEM